MNKRILSALVALVMLALPLCGVAAPEYGSVLQEGIAQSLEAGKALVCEISFDSNVAQELGDAYASAEKILNDLQIRVLKQAVGDVQQADIAINAKGEEILTLTLAGDAQALYGMSNLLGDRTLAISYEQLANFVRDAATSYVGESAQTFQQIDPNLLMPYMTTVMAWAGTKLAKTVEEENVATDQHPDAVKKETVTVTSADLSGLVEEITAQMQADEALLAAVASQEQKTVEEIQADIEQFKGQALAQLAKMEQPVEWVCLYDEAGTVLSQKLTLSGEEEGVAKQIEFEYHHNALSEDSTQDTMDLVFVQGEDVVRLYLTKGLETVSDTEAQGEKNLLGADSMKDGQSASIRLEAFAQILTGVDAESINLEIGLTTGGAAYEQMFKEMGFAKVHDLYLAGSIENKRSEEGVSGSSQLTLSMDAQHIPLVTINTVLSTQEAQELLSTEGATDVFSLTEEESSNLFFEILTNVSVVLAELESLYPELFAAETVG
ncbi:MAG TPA: hypothetical protein PKE04_14570 [Clostridia bacterium]|nr:hypothetical protein [Clostridia bacterium]